MEDAGLDFLLDVVDTFPLREEFADSLEHSDPIPPAVLRTGEANPTVPAESNAGSGCGQQVCVAGPEEAQGGMHRRREASPTRSAQLTDRVNRRRQVGQKGEARSRGSSKISTGLPTDHTSATHVAAAMVRPAHKSLVLVW